MKKLNIIIVLIFLMLLIGSIFCYMYVDDFFDLKFSNFISFAIAIGFAFYLTRLLTVRDRKRQEIVKLIDDIILVLSDRGLIGFDSDHNAHNVLMMIRNIRNQMDILYRVKKGYIKDCDYKYIMEKIDEYEEIVSERIENLVELSNNLQIKKPLDLCITKLKELKYDILFEL